MQLDSEEGILDAVLEAMAHPTRRDLLSYLRDEEVATVDELVNAVATGEEDTLHADGAASTRERLAIEVSHVHLPKLADASCIQYDHRSCTARYSNPPAAVHAVLEAIDGLETELDG